MRQEKMMSNFWAAKQAVLLEAQEAHAGAVNALIQVHEDSICAQENRRLQIVQAESARQRAAIAQLQEADHAARLAFCQDLGRNSDFQAEAHRSDRVAQEITTLLQQGMVKREAMIQIVYTGLLSMFTDLRTDAEHRFWLQCAADIGEVYMSFYASCDKVGEGWSAEVDRVSATLEEEEARTKAWERLQVKATKRVLRHVHTLLLPTPAPEVTVAANFPDREGGHLEWGRRSVLKRFHEVLLRFRQDRDRAARQAEGVKRGWETALGDWREHIIATQRRLTKLEIEEEKKLQSRTWHAAHNEDCDMRSRLCVRRDDAAAQLWQSTQLEKEVVHHWRETWNGVSNHVREVLTELAAVGSRSREQALGRWNRHHEELETACKSLVGRCNRHIASQDQMLQDRCSRVRAQALSLQDKMLQEMVHRFCLGGSATTETFDKLFGDSAGSSPVETEKVQEIRSWAASQERLHLEALESTNRLAEGQMADLLAELTKQQEESDEAARSDLSKSMDACIQAHQDWKAEELRHAEQSKADDAAMAESVLQKIESAVALGAAKLGASASEGPDHSRMKELLQAIVPSIWREVQQQQDAWNNVFLQQEAWWQSRWKEWLEEEDSAGRLAAWSSHISTQQERLSIDIEAEHQAQWHKVSNIVRQLSKASLQDVEAVLDLFASFKEQCCGRTTPHDLFATLHKRLASSIKVAQSKLRRAANERARQVDGITEACWCELHRDFLALKAVVVEAKASLLAAHHRLSVPLQLPSATTPQVDGMQDPAQVEVDSPLEDTAQVTSPSAIPESTPAPEVNRSELQRSNVAGEGGVDPEVKIAEFMAYAEGQLDVAAANITETTEKWAEAAQAELILEMAEVQEHVEEGSEDATAVLTAFWSDVLSAAQLEQGEVKACLANMLTELANSAATFDSRDALNSAAQQAKEKLGLGLVSRKLEAYLQAEQQREENVAQTEVGELKKDLVQALGCLQHELDEEDQAARESPRLAQELLRSRLAESLTELN
ncbi:unnamed protein product [Chrysoparadoxa australica]